ncbi:hypothetical protein A1O3_02421 [Capronia epimyces CBS 606.96]|uniref:Methyltransferase domain-containing protein n=1 Tax=Capronia epimyces CBS 606.96 TaxID=1182542 RepID=W9Z4E7_9EURO|nr:uncharacterized protein A1O3_02421 [Capronia epimyces CBS 606.96]EXJ89354.1 hypothetical protein A1O3_02421 [Capronia epimyces CBS 606.96]
MLPTPSTSHVSYDRIYEPAEDSYLFLDTLSSASETAWLHSRFNPASASLSDDKANTTTSTSTSTARLTPTPIPTSKPTPLLVEIGPGSGVIIAFLTAHAGLIFGRDVLSLGVDVNPHACRAARTTVEKALSEAKSTRGKQTATRTPEKDSCGGGDGNTSPPLSSLYLASLTGDLATSLRPGEVDVLIFNPPYVPTDSVPDIERPGNSTPAPAPAPTPIPAPTPTPTPAAVDVNVDVSASVNGTTPPDVKATRALTFEESSHLLALSYAGGVDGMQVTTRLLHELPRVLSPRGVAYILFCRGNKPEDVKGWIRDWDDGSGGRWSAETVGSSGKTAGWEKLEIVRIWRE